MRFSVQNARVRMASPSVMPYGAASSLSPAPERVEGLGCLRSRMAVPTADDVSRMSSASGSTASAATPSQTYDQRQSLWASRNTTSGANTADPTFCDWAMASANPWLRTNHFVTRATIGTPVAERPTASTTPK